MKSTIYLIRHGITTGNLNGWFYGELDLPLLPESIRKIETLRDEGLYPPAEDADLYTSGMLRTEQTLRSIYGDAPHRVIPEFREFHCGIFEGKCLEELRAEPEFMRFYDDPSDSYVIPDGESLSQFRLRILEGWKKLIGFHRLKQLSHRHSGLPATSVVVCHGGVINYIMQTFFGSENDRRFQWTPETGHGYAISLENSEPASYDPF